MVERKIPSRIARVSNTQIQLAPKSKNSTCEVSGIRYHNHLSTTYKKQPFPNSLEDSAGQFRKSLRDPSDLIAGNVAWHLPWLRKCRPAIGFPSPAKPQHSRPHQSCGGSSETINKAPSHLGNHQPASTSQVVDPLLRLVTDYISPFFHDRCSFTFNFAGAESSSFVGDAPIAITHCHIPSLANATTR